MQAEELCDTAEDNFVRILCDLIQFEVIETIDRKIIKTYFSGGPKWMKV